MFQVREVNLYKEGDTTPHGLKLENCTVRELWAKCKEDSQYEQRLEEVKEFNRYIICYVRKEVTKSKFI